MADLSLITSDNPQADAPRLPALPVPELSVEYIGRIKEILESLLGRRGSDYDRAVTFRDLFAQGDKGDTFTPAQLEQWLAKSETLRALKRKIGGSIEEVGGIADELRAQLQLSLSDLARARQADIRTVEQKIQTNGLSMASRLQELTASLNGLSAGVREFDSASADTIRAVAVRVEQLSASIDGGGSADIEQRLEAIADLVDGLRAQYTLKVQTNPVNGQPPVIAGINLSATSPIAGPGTSELIFMAEAFKFLTNNGSKQLITIEGDEIVFNGRVKARSLQLGAPDNLIADPQFKDLAYWGRVGCAVGDWTLAAQNTPWKGGASLYLGQGTGTQRESDTPYFNIEPGATYRVDFQISVPADFNGAVSVFLLMPATAWVPMSNISGRRGYWPDGLSKDFTSADAGQLLTFSSMMTVPNDSRNSRALIRIRDQYTSSQLEIGAMSITRVADGSLVGDGVLSARHIVGDTLDVLAAYFGSVQLGVGGALWTGQSAYDTGVGLRLGTNAADDPYFSMRSGSGKFVRFRPSTDTFETSGQKLISPDIEGLILPPFTASLSGGGMTSSGANGTRTLGSRQITGNGGLLPYRSISWAVTVLEGTGATYTLISGENTDTVTVTATGTNATARARITGTIIDANGTSATASFTTNANFGAV